MNRLYVLRIKDIISNLKPSNLYVKYKLLFSINWRGQSKYEDYSDNEIYLDKERCIALREIINTYGFDSVFKLANIVESQKTLAETISNELTLEEISHSLITTLLNHNCSQFSHVVLVYLYEKHSGLFNKIDSEQWKQEDWLKLFLILPATPRLWVYVDRILKDDVLSRYWMQARINYYAIYIYKTEKEALGCLNRLIGANRCIVAVNLIWRLKPLFSDLFSDEEVWELLVKVATSGDSQETVILDRQAALCLIENLQESEALNLVQKADLEILYSVWIFDTHQSQVKATYLEKRIANEPLYYLEWYQVHVSKHINVNTNIKKLASKIISNVKRAPGITDDGSFSSEEFYSWLSSATDKANEQNLDIKPMRKWLGKTLFYAPKDLNDLWCPQILEILNADENADLLKAFQDEIFDSRGVRLVDLTGQEEFELADKYKKLAVLAEQEGFWNVYPILYQVSADFQSEGEATVNGDLYGQP